MDGLNQSCVCIPILLEYTVFNRLTLLAKITHQFHWQPVVSSALAWREDSIPKAMETRGERRTGVREKESDDEKESDKNIPESCSIIGAVCQSPILCA